MRVWRGRSLGSNSMAVPRQPRYHPRQFRRLLLAMFVCISANPAIDKRLHLTRLVPGGVNRVTDVKAAPGGKATHVAMVLQTLGADPSWIGFSGGASGQELLDGLRTLGIRTHPVPTQQ